jgi:hypothetical protein
MARRTCGGGILPRLPNSPGGPTATGLFLFGRAARQGSGFGSLRQTTAPLAPIVSDVPMSYRKATEHHMTLLSKIFTTRTLVQIIFVLTAMIVMKAMSSHYDFSWASALAAG